MGSGFEIVEQSRPLVHTTIFALLPMIEALAQALGRLCSFAALVHMYN